MTGAQGGVVAPDRRVSKGMSPKSRGVPAVPRQEGFYADIAVFRESEIRDLATYERPHQYATGTVHVLVNGEFAFRDGSPTSMMAGRPIRRGGR